MLKSAIRALFRAKIRRSANLYPPPSTSTRSENKNVLHNLCVRLGSLILKEKQTLAVEALLSFKGVMVYIPTGSGNPSLFNAFLSFQNFGNASILVYIASAKQAVLPEFTAFVNLLALVVLDKYNCTDSQLKNGYNRFADTAFIFRRILSRNMTRQTRADELDAQFNGSLRFSVRISQSELLPRLAFLSLARLICSPARLSREGLERGGSKFCMWCPLSHVGLPVYPSEENSKCFSVYPIAQFRYIKIELETKDITTRLRGII